MWKTGLLAAAVGVATLVGTILIGRPLVEPEADPETLVVATSERSWAEAASTHCRRALADVRAELSSAGTQANTPERSVRLFGSTTEIEGRLLRQLQAVPSSTAQRDGVEEALALFQEQYDRDVDTVAKLEDRYDFALLSREVTTYERVAAQLRVLFRNLGAEGCAAYFDPQSYR